MGNAVSSTEVKMVFSVPQSTKTEFHVALIKRDMIIKHTIEAFLEVFIAYTKGEKYPDPIMTIIERSNTLAKG
jgi:hypothetical protein